VKERNAIGIDPDSQGFVCAYVKRSDTKVANKGYLATDSDLKSFLDWVKGEKDVVVAIEGSNGLSKPIEKALREAGIVFYSFKPADTDKFRKAVLGQNKNNQKDAESVARYAMALEAQGKLGNYRRVWFADMELQLLIRRYGSLTKQLTAEGNRLWKLLRYACPDLYLALGGKNPEVECDQKMVKSQGILNLLVSTPDVGQWKRLSDEQMLEAMGGGNYKGRRELIQELRKVMGSFQPASDSMALLLSSSAHLIQRLKEEQLHIVRMLEELTAGNAAVQALRQMRGIGTVTASTMIAEIVDIRRFAREDSLACYSGLGMQEHSTGRTTNMVPTRLFNHRLKDAFMTAAWNVVFYNPDSHIAGYNRNLVKAGMTPLEARKRVARALVRVMYRKLSALLVTVGTVDEQTGDEQEGGESGMASGTTRSGQSHTSDISLLSPRSNRAKGVKRVKSEVTATRNTKDPGRRRTISKKNT
jgi:transposase